MRLSFGVTTLSSVLICALAGCSSLDPQDELVGESADQDALEDNAGSAANGEYTYFGITADLRKCPSPLCGGWFIKNLNRVMTECHDGRHAETCYTPALDWSEANLSDPQRARLLDASSQDTDSGGVFAIVRGRFEPTNTTPQPAMGRFVIGEAWVAEGDTVSDGVFVRVKDNGLRCFAAPCPSFTEHPLNKTQSADIAGIDWTPARLSDIQISECVAAMATADGVLVSGYRYMMWGDAGAARGRTATAAYYRLTPE